MTAKIKFLDMFNKLPEKARSGLVFNFAVYPQSLSVCAQEIRNNTKLGEQILHDLGFDE